MTPTGMMVQSMMMMPETTRTVKISLTTTMKRTRATMRKGTTMGKTTIPRTEIPRTKIPRTKIPRTKIPMTTILMTTIQMTQILMPPPTNTWSETAMERNQPTALMKSWILIKKARGKHPMVARGQKSWKMTSTPLAFRQMIMELTIGAIFRGLIPALIQWSVRCAPRTILTQIPS